MERRAGKGGSMRGTQPTTARAWKTRRNGHQPMYQGGPQEARANPWLTSKKQKILVPQPKGTQIPPRTRERAGRVDSLLEYPETTLLTPDISPVGSLWPVTFRTIRKEKVWCFTQPVSGTICGSKKYDKKYDHESHMLTYIRKITAIHFQSVLVK